MYITKRTRVGELLLVMVFNKVNCKDLKLREAIALLYNMSTCMNNAYTKSINIHIAYLASLHILIISSFNNVSSTLLRYLMKFKLTRLRQHTTLESMEINSN